MCDLSFESVLYVGQTEDTNKTPSVNRNQSLQRASVRLSKAERGRCCTVGTLVQDQSLDEVSNLEQLGRQHGARAKHGASVPRSTASSVCQLGGSHSLI